MSRFRVSLTVSALLAAGLLAVVSPDASAVVRRDIVLDPPQLQSVRVVESAEGFTQTTQYLTAPLGGASEPLASHTDYHITVRLPEGVSFLYDPAYRQFEAALYFENQPPPADAPIGSLGMQRDAFQFTGENVSSAPLDFRNGNEALVGSTTLAIKLFAAWPIDWVRADPDEPILIDRLDFRFAFIGAFNNPAPDLSLGQFRFGGNTSVKGDAIATPAVRLFNLGDPLPTGDFNASRTVEQGDLDLVLQNWGANTDTLLGAPAGWVNPAGLDGVIDQAELDAVLQNWGVSNAPDFRGANVPEPITGAGLLVLLLRPRRRHGCDAFPVDAAA